MNFNRTFDTYDENAVVQKKVADKLTRLMERNLPNKNYHSIFEIGCGTGIFTKRYLEDFQCDCLILNDICDTREFFDKINYKKFIVENIEKVEIETSELIVSSSVLQWVQDLEKLMKNISQKCDFFCFSIYIYENLLEVKKHFDISLGYYKVEEIREILNRYFKIIDYKNEEIKLSFDTPLLALKHLKKTGVTGINQEISTIGKIKTYPYRTLTYKVAYFLCERRK